MVALNNPKGTSTQVASQDCDEASAALLGCGYSHIFPNAAMNESKSATETAPSLLRSYGQQLPMQPYAALNSSRSETPMTRS